MQQAWLFRQFTNSSKDVIYGFRTFWKNPLFAATVVVTIALGIASNTTMFTVIDQVLLRPLAYPNPDQLVRISLENARRNVATGGLTPIRFEQMKAVRSFTAIGNFLIAPEQMTLSGRGQAEQLQVARVSGNFIDILGVRPIIGRSFTAQEDTPGGAAVALISERLWKSRFGGSRDALGQTMVLNGAQYSVIGVLPGTLQFPFAGTEVWIAKPAQFSNIPAQFWSRTPTQMGIARLRPGISMEQARAELQLFNTDYIRSHSSLPDAEPGVVLRIARLQDALTQNLRSMLWTLFGAVGFVLLIACANVASLLIAQGASRRQEFAMRAALGAGRGRLIRQVLVESLLLALIGGLLGVVLSRWGLKALGQVTLDKWPQAGTLHLDTTVLLFTLVLSVITGILFGLAPSIYFSRPDLADMLRERSERGNTEGPSNGIWGLNTRGVLMVAQVALSIILLIGAGLLLRSFVRLHEVNPGFRTRNLLTMQIALPTTRYDTPQKRVAFWQNLLAHVNTIPAVEKAAVVLTLPATPAYVAHVQAAEQPPSNLQSRPVALQQSVTLDYFQTLGIPLLQGRLFSPHDTSDSQAVTIINETLARRLWPGNQSPIGQHLLIGSGTTGNEIVGVVANVREHSLTEEAAPEFYLINTQAAPWTAYLVLHTKINPLDVADSVRRQLSAIDPDQAVSKVRTMDEVLGASLGSRQLVLFLLGLFAILALILALVGIYGATAYSVAQRASELGVRRALGAQSRDILVLIGGNTLRLTIVGIIVGFAGSIALTRFLKSFLFQVTQNDPSTFVGVALLFLIVTLISSYIPCRRALRIDPMKALR